MFDYSELLGSGQAAYGPVLGSLGSYALSQGQQDMAAAQQAAIGPFSSFTLGCQPQASTQLKTMSSSDYSTVKQKYSKFKKCENPIKQSELTYGY